MAAEGVETVATDRRRESRVPVHLPMLIPGKGRNGKWFEEGAFADNLSGGGAAFTALNPLEMGANIFISIPASPFEQPDTEFSTKDRVVYLKSVHGSRGKTFGVKFIGSRFQRSFVSVWA